MIKKGITLSFVTAIISGCSIFANAVFVSKTDPLIFAIIRNTVVAVLLTAILVVAGHTRKLGSLTRRQWAQLVFIGAIGGGIPFALFFTGLAEIGAVNGNIIQKTLFLWVAILAIPLLHERISKIQFVGYITLFLGMFFFGGTSTVIPKTGTWLILAATMLWAVENVIAKITLKSVPATVVSWGRMVFGLPFLFLAVAIAGKLSLLGTSVVYAPTPIIISSIFLTLYVTTWYSALSQVPATLVSSILVVAPVVTALLSSVVLKKPIFVHQAVNLVFLATGTVLLVIERLTLKKQQQV